MPALVVPDAMPDIRQWLRANARLTPLVGGRVFFRIPETPSKAPFIRVYRSGGGIQLGSETPISNIRVSIDVWGQAGRDYEAVRQTAQAIEQEAFVAVPGSILGSNGTVLHNISITTVFDTPDPETGWPRIALDSMWTVTI